MSEVWAIIIGGCLLLILYGIVAQQLGTDPPVSIDDLFLVA